MNIKRAIIISVVLIVIAINLSGEIEIIENTATPRSKNAGRILVP